MGQFLAVPKDMWKTIGREKRPTIGKDSGKNLLTSLDFSGHFQRRGAGARYGKAFIYFDKIDSFLTL